MELLKIGDVCNYLTGDPYERIVVIEKITSQDDKNGFATYIVRDLETGKLEETASENLSLQLQPTLHSIAYKRIISVKKDFLSAWDNIIGKCPMEFIKETDDGEEAKNDISRYFVVIIPREMPKDDISRLRGNF